MANMSYCRHENTSSDLHDALVQWDDWAEDNQPQSESSYESRARRHIMAQAVALTRALEERELLLADDSVAEHAEYEALDIAFPLR